MGVGYFAVRGILLSDSDSIKYAISGIQDVVVITDSGDGFIKTVHSLSMIIYRIIVDMDARLYRSLRRCSILSKIRNLKSKNTDIINTWVEKSYLPFIYNGRTMDMVRGREISRYYEQSDFACSRILGNAYINGVIRI